MKNNLKSNDTSIRALEVLKLLNCEPHTQDELINKIFQAKKSEYELRVDTLYKYINTFKLFGINFTKNKNKYEIDKAPILQKLSEREISSLQFLWTYANKIYTAETLQQIETLLKNLLKNFSNLTFEDLNLPSTEYDKFKKIIETDWNKENILKYQQLCKEKQKISFAYQNRYLNQTQNFTVEPVEVLITPTSCILMAYNPEIAETQTFYTEDITELKQLPTLSKPVNIKNSVTFALKGRLASAYELKQGERVTKMEPEYLVITNTEEDKAELMKRLLRYGRACEILYPKTFRNKTLELIAKIKKNYE